MSAYHNLMSADYYLFQWTQSNIVFVQKVEIQWMHVWQQQCHFQEPMESVTEINESWEDTVLKILLIFSNIQWWGIRSTRYNSLTTWSFVSAVLWHETLASNAFAIILQIIKLFIKLNQIIYYLLLFYRFCAKSSFIYSKVWWRKTENKSH